MGKRTLPATEASELRRVLQVGALDALMAVRRWEPGDLVFQGGTSLHLVHGSPRFSEDLDFLVRNTLDLGTIGQRVLDRLSRSSWIPPDARLRVTSAHTGRNPHTFDLVLGGPRIYGSVRVKVELWRASPAAMEPIEFTVSAVRLVSGPNAGAQAFVPAATEREILADKVFAFAARPYLKARDVFDLAWLTPRNAGPACTTEALRIRLATYPDETPRGWMDKARDRLERLPDQQADIGRDLKRWLPSSWAIRDEDTRSMIASATAALNEGIEAMRPIAGGAER